VIYSCLDDDVYAETRNHPEVRSLQASVRHVLNELYASLDLERRSSRRQETPSEEMRRWERRFKQTMRKLRESGVATRRDVERGWEEYRAQREEWEAKLQRFASYLGYEWDEVTGDRDLRYAADEEMEKQG
jgi:hypothetical protein